ncbi:MAG: ISL3 family transposase [Lachnospiraceae bacterium]|nr:ISL3 family transposase [Lachnospiraceae bacterium]
MFNQPDLNSILALPSDVKILSAEDCPAQNRITLDVEFKPEEQVCPRCGSRHCFIRETREPQTIRHLPSASRSVFIRFTPRRFIDDFRGNAGVYNPKKKWWDAPVFQTCVVDGASGRIIDILHDRSAATVQGYFLSFPESQRKNVKFYSCDMSGIYATAARRIFPEAVLCTDRFHVVQWLNKAVDAVRRRLQNEFRNDPAKYAKLKDSRLMLLTKECNQRTYWEAYGYEKKLARLQTLLAEFPDLCEVFDAMQEYHFICTADMEPIRRLRLAERINKYLSSDVEEVRIAAKTVRNWKENILNSFTYNITNGPVEALNSQIKRLKKISCGVHDFDNFRKRILLCFGSTSFVRNQYTIFGEKRAHKISIKKEDLNHD